jgi:hypothetical protein
MKQITLSRLDHARILKKHRQRQAVWYYKNRRSRKVLNELGNAAIVEPREFRPML